MENLTAALIQLKQPVFEGRDTDAVRGVLQAYSHEIERLGGDVDLIVLPEVFNASFMQLSSNSSEPYSEPAGGITYQWMQQQAARTGAVITGSIIVETSRGEYVNRLVWMRPDGQYDEYDKRHLFRMAGEHERYRAGTDKLVVTLKGWRICPLICYDLRFPVYSRNRYKNSCHDYDLLLYVAAWPQARRHHWRSLLLARAIENQVCVIGVNRLGTDCRGLDYSGDSLIFDAQGEVLQDQLNRQGVELCELSAADLKIYREAFPAYLDADTFELL